MSGDVSDKNIRVVPEQPENKFSAESQELQQKRQAEVAEKVNGYSRVESRGVAPVADSGFPQANLQQGGSIEFRTKIGDPNVQSYSVRVGYVEGGNGGYFSTTRTQEVDLKNRTMTVTTDNAAGLQVGKSN